jgi:hypothetical protein
MDVVLPIVSGGRQASERLGGDIWRQLLLLGFDAAAYMKQEAIRDGSLLGPRMFHSQSPNKSGLFCVLHFLFGMIDAAYKEVRVRASTGPSAGVVLVLNARVGVRGGVGSGSRRASPRTTSTARSSSASRPSRSLTSCARRASSRRSAACVRRRC